MKNYVIQINRGGELKWIPIQAESAIHAVRNISMALARDPIPFDIVSIMEQIEQESLDREQAALQDPSNFSPRVATGERLRPFEIIP